MWAREKIAHIQDEKERAARQEWLERILAGDDPTGGPTAEMAAARLEGMAPSMGFVD